MVGQVVGWAPLVFFSGQTLVFLTLVLWFVWNTAIRPRLIPAGNIDRAAADIIAHHPDPEKEAFARHEAEWHRSKGAEQVYWRRVRKAVRRRMAR